jgi:ABC-type Fe3+-siderophore transport system permease subunit
MIEFLAQTTSGSGAVAGAAVLGFGVIFFIFWLALIAFAITGFVFWILSLIHVIQHDDVKDRTMWIVILLLVGNIGGLIYFFSVKKQYDKGGAREIV